MSPDPRPLLSIVIPTRERVRFLAAAIETALRCADPRIEILVSDNASQDGTAALVENLMATRGDPRLRYANTGARLPVSGSFEFAFSQARGRHLLYCGDDDGVLPHGIAALLGVLEARDPDIVTWPEAVFIWPDEARCGGYLQLRRDHFQGGVATLDPAAVLRAVCAGTYGSFFAHYGTVSRRLVDRVVARTGRYFLHLDPGCAGFCNLLMADSYLRIGRPVSLYGRSAASKTRSLRVVTAAAGTVDPHAAFVAEHAGGAEATIDPRVRVIWAVAFDALMVALEACRLPHPPVDAERWRARIAGELHGLPGALQAEQAAIVNAMLERRGVAPLAAPAGSGERSNRHAGGWRPAFQVSANRLRLGSARGGLDTIAQASAMADRILDNTPLAPGPQPAVGAWTWTRAVARSWRVSRAPGRGDTREAS